MFDAKMTFEKNLRSISSAAAQRREKIQAGISESVGPSEIFLELCPADF